MKMSREDRRRLEELGLIYPEPLPSPVVYYGKDAGKYPETIRMSFADGHTEIYERRVEQPSPQAYLNMPSRRRRRRKP